MPFDVCKLNDIGSFCWNFAGIIVIVHVQTVSYIHDPDSGSRLTEISAIFLSLLNEIVAVFEFKSTTKCAKDRVPALKGVLGVLYSINPLYQAMTRDEPQLCSELADSKKNCSSKWTLNSCGRPHFTLSITVSYQSKVCEVQRNRNCLLVIERASLYRPCVKGVLYKSLA